MQIHTNFRPGDLGYIIYLHGSLYAAEYGLDHTFEGEVAARMGEFAKSFDPKKDYSKEPTTLVEFRLEEVGEGTRLTVVESGFDRIPAGRRDEAFRMNSEGWAIQMQNILGHVAG